MAFINGNWTLDKKAIINYYKTQLGDVFLSGDVVNKILDYDSVRNFENEHKQKAKVTNPVKGIKQNRLQFFIDQIKQRAEKYTPIQDDERHNKEHPKEPHLRDAFKIEYINNNAYKLVNTNSYAAAVHEDAEGRQPARHEYPTRSHYLLEAAEEVSAEYGYPFNVYIKIGPENVSIIAENPVEYSELSNGEHNVVEIDEESNTFAILKALIYLGNYYRTIEVKEPGYNKLVNGHLRSSKKYFEALKRLEDEEKAKHPYLSDDYDDDISYNLYDFIDPNDIFR